VSLSEATGIDNLNQESFLPTLEEQTHIISDKVLKGSFKYAQCQGADFGHAQCQGADFRDAQCQGADLK
jgi:uncharacterized protein YjbI with pentapeptide repeats